MSSTATAWVVIQLTYVTRIILSTHTYIDIYFQHIHIYEKDDIQ